jgi:regulator of cell morphogenesis and NO signaling
MKVSGYTNKTVSEIVRNDYRTADVFKSFGINYCCGGQVQLEEACAARSIDVDELVSALDTATRTVSLPNNLHYESWKLDFLVEYIVNVHHAYLYSTVPDLQASLTSFAASHRKQHPELKEIVETFDQLATALMQHNRHEEEIIFPYIKQIDNTHRRKETYGSLFVRTLRKPLSTIEAEHDKISKILTELRSLTHNYSYPGNACTNHRVVFNKLKEFDEDLTQHKYLENNVLFPRAIALERELLQA